MRQDDYDSMMLRTAFYRDSARSAMVMVERLSVALAICLIALVMSFVAGRDHIVHYVDERGVILRDPALDQPNASDADVVEWAASAAVRAGTYAFNDYRTRFDRMHDDFTRAGWAEYQRIILGSPNFQAVKNGALRMSIAIHQAGPATLSASGLGSDHRWTWVVSMPYDMLFTDRSGQTHLTGTAILTIERIHLNESMRGYGIRTVKFINNQTQPGAPGAGAPGVDQSRQP